MAISIQSVMHVNVNCRDLERSLRFYRELVGLKAESHTKPLPQRGEGFGFEESVQWDAHILHDGRGVTGPGVDLLQWHQPSPVDRPYEHANHVGFFRICVLVSDVDATHAAAEAAGVHCYSAPCEVLLGPERGQSVRMFNCIDPDGTTVEFVEQAGLPEARLFHVNANCRDLELSLEWYQRILGMEVRGESQPGPVSGEVFGLPGEVEWDGRLLWPAGQDAFAIDLVEWKQPRPTGRAYPSANHLGIYRMAFMVEDIQASYAELSRQGVLCRPPVFLDMGPEIPIDGVWALFFPDPDGICLELIETPSLR